jgi:lantibiotic transport system permease protein
MYSFIISLRSEFYKTRFTLAFLSAILLPLLLCGLIFTGFYINSDKLIGLSPMVQWFRYSGAFLGVMGSLVLPILVIFQTFSVNNIEHRAGMWKSLFSLPLPKWSVYSSKFAYSVLLNALCLSLFATFILASGYLMNILKPELGFSQFDMSGLLFKLHLKLFLASIGILSIQFLFSLLWADFLKPMGIGFLLTIFGIITANIGWKYAFAIPYAQPMLALNSLFAQLKTKAGTSMTFDLLTKEVYVSLAVGLVAFIAGYFIIQKRSVK